MGGGLWDSLPAILVLSAPVLLAAAILGVRDYLRDGRKRRGQKDSEQHCENRERLEA
jgi:hypothetical protein